MSKAFTREENDGPDLPDLPPPVSILPEAARNFITAAGAENLRRELTELVNEKRPTFVAAATDDPDAKRQLAALDQRIFQLEQSLQSAEVIVPPEGDAETVRFGATVIVRDRGGEESTYRIVGVNETDFDRGWVSWQSPIARALLNGKLGERVPFQFPSGEEELEIRAIDYE
ncbi:MAG: GreA/GreB family elongation factor [Chthoniobacterales bacterium]|nr:GreA/GreB family elongation factor [Chthoniobacterales bacterium]